MEDFALNGAAINGQAYELIYLDGATTIALETAGEGLRGRLLDGSADISLDTTGAIGIGPMLSGDVDIALETTADFYRGLMAGGAIAVSLDTDMVPMLRTSITGDVDIDLVTSMTGAAGIRGEGTMLIAIDGLLDMLRRAMAEGTIDIEFELAGDGRLVQRVQLDGEIGIYLDPFYLDGRRTQAHRPDMPLSIDVGVEGAPWLEMHSMAGTAAIDFVMDGVARLGGKVKIDGACEIELITSGQARQYRRVPIEGAVGIEFVLIAERAGRPLIPTEYVPAPTGRQFTVQRQPRERRIPFERRL